MTGAASILCKTNDGGCTHNQKFANITVTLRTDMPLMRSFQSYAVAVSILAMKQSDVRKKRY